MQTTLTEDNEVTNFYRHFDADEQLLYIGVSLSGIKRLSEHSQNAHWFNSITDVTIESFTSRNEALSAEKKAIKIEKPLHNVVGNTISRKNNEKQFLVRMDDQDFGAHKELHIERTTTIRDDLSFNAFVVELLNKEFQRKSIAKFSAK